MLRQMLLNSTAAARSFDMMTQTHAPPTLNVSQGPVSVAALLKPTGRGGGLREGELNKPDLATYVVMCLLLFLLVLLIVFFINCQLRSSFFASMPYDRSLREARSSYKWTGPYMLNQSTPIWDQAWYGRAWVHTILCWLLMDVGWILHHDWDKWQWSVCASVCMGVRVCMRAQTCLYRKHFVLRTIIISVCMLSLVHSCKTNYFLVHH